MSKWPMRGHFRYLRFKTFPMTPRTPQFEVFFPFLSSSEHSGVPKDSKSSTFPSVGLHPHTWPKWGCDTCALALFLVCVSPFYKLFLYESHSLNSFSFSSKGFILCSIFVCCWLSCNLSIWWVLWTLIFNKIVFLPVFFYFVQKVFMW